MVNMTEISQLSQGEAISQIHQTAVMPNLLILYIAFSLILLLVGIVMINPKKSGYGKFLTIYFITITTVGICILLPLILLPNLTTDIMDFLSKLFTFN